MASLMSGPLMAVVESMLRRIVNCSDYMWIASCDGPRVVGLPTLQPGVPRKNA